MTEFSSESLFKRSALSATAAERHPPAGNMRLLVALAATTTTVFAQSTTTTIYVNTTGSDSNTGLLPTHPLATIAAALAKVPAHSSQGAVTVQVAGGNYFLSSPLEIAKQHSGTASGAVKLVGIGNVRVVGGFAANATPAVAPLRWQARTLPAGAMQIDLSAIADLGTWAMQGGYEHDCVGTPLELFVNGAPMTVARWPNVDPNPGNSTNMVWSRTEKGSGGGGLHDLSPSTVAKLLNVSSNSKEQRLGAIFHGYKPKRRSSCSLRRVRHYNESCEDQAAPTIAHNRARRAAWHASKNLPPLDWDHEAARSPSFTLTKSAASAIGDWDDLSTAWVHGTWAYEWEDTMGPITEYTKGERKITVGMPMPADNGVTAQAKFYVFNALSALDVAGEYFVDTKARKLYFLPPTAAPDTTGASSLELFLSTQTTLLRAKNVSHFEIHNIGFEVARQDGLDIDSCGPRFVMNGLTVKNTGRHGVVIIGGTDVVLQNSEIVWAGGSGVQVEGGDKAKLIRSEHVVEHNTIHHFERICLTYNPGVKMGGVGVTTRNNLLYSTPHHALEPLGNDQLLEGNVVHHCTQDTFDNGCVHLQQEWHLYLTPQSSFSFPHRVSGARFSLPPPVASTGHPTIGRIGTTLSRAMSSSMGCQKRWDAINSHHLSGPGSILMTAASAG